MELRENIRLVRERVAAAAREAGMSNSSFRYRAVLYEMQKNEGGKGK